MAENSSRPNRNTVGFTKMSYFQKRFSFTEWQILHQCNSLNYKDDYFDYTHDCQYIVLILQFYQIAVVGEIQLPKSIQNIPVTIAQPA